METVQTSYPKSVAEAHERHLIGESTSQAEQVAARPAGNGEVDTQAVNAGVDRLDQASGGIRA